MGSIAREADAVCRWLALDEWVTYSFETYRSSFSEILNLNTADTFSFDCFIRFGFGKKEKQK